jgi:hypothetical protein
MARNDPFADLAPPNKKKDDPFADLAPPPRVGFPAKTLSPLKIGAPSFQQFADAGAELPAAPTPLPKKKYDTAFAEDILQRRAKAQPAQPQPTQPPEPRRLGYQPSKTPYAGDIGDGSLLSQVGRLAGTTKAEANRPVERFQQDVLNVLKTPEYIGRQALPAISGMAQPFVEGAYNLLGRPDIAEYTRQLQQKIEQASAPQSPVEAAIGVPLRLAGLVAPYMAAGGTAAPLSLSAALTGIQSQAKGGSFVEFLSDKLDSDVLKSIATSKYKTPADMVLDMTLGVAFGSLDNIRKAGKTTRDVRAALRAQGADPFVQSGNLFREGVQSGVLTAQAAEPFIKAADKLARQAQGGAGARAVDAVVGLGSSATQFGKNVASNVGAEAKLFSDAGEKLAEQAALSGAQVPIPKKPTQGRIDRAAFGNRIIQALDDGNQDEVTRLLERQDEVLSGVAPEVPTQVPLRPAFSGQTSVLNRPFAPSLVTKAVRKEAPSVAGEEWAARQRELGERGVPEVRSNVAEYGQASQPMQRATAVDKEFQKKVADWYDNAESNPNDKEVQAAYRAFAEETSKQYEYLTNKGMTFEFVDNPSSYQNSGEMMKDIAENKHLFVFKTGDDFDHPLLSAKENDQFRAVHDYFGHAAYGHQFGELGEENAFRVHAATFSPEARRAMATETRGQNSWVNTRPENVAAPGTVYADQKVVLLPKQFMKPYPAETPIGALTNRATYLANMGGKEAAAATAGAAIGAAGDEENRLRGAGVGALVGLGAARGGAIGLSTRRVDDISGALNKGISSLSGTQLANAGLGAVGYGMSQLEDERLQTTGDAMMGIAAYSLVHGKVKQGAKYTGSKIAEELAKFSAGRKALDEISLDIRTDPRIKEVFQQYARERSKLEAIGRELTSGVQKRGPVFERVVSDLADKETIETGTLSTEDMALAVAFAQKLADNSLGLKKVGADIISYDTYLKQGGPNFLPRRYARYEAEDVNDVVVQYKGKTFRIGGERIRNNLLTREERDALGEIREASYRIADYFGRGARDITTAHLFQALADIPGVIHPEYVSAVREAAIGADLAKVARTPTKGFRGSPTAAKDALRAADAAKDRAKALGEQFKRQGQEYVTLPDTPQLGVLRGAVVRKDAADYLNDLPDFRSTVSEYNKALKYWKTIKTVFNPPTHVANFVANWPVAMMNGLPFHELMTTALPRAHKDIQAYGPATRFLAEAGVLERAALTYGDVPTKGVDRDKTVLRSMLKTTRPETREALEAQGLKPMSKAEEKVRAIGKGFGSLYSTGDAIFRVALFQKLTKNGLGQEEALAKVMEAFPDYGTRSPLLQKIKFVSPFVMYSAKYIPTFLDKIAEQPWRWALVASSWAAIDQASRRKAGAVDEMDLPPNRRFTKLGYLLPGLIQAEALGVKSDQVGERKMIDIARFTPLTALSGSTSPGSPVSAISQNVPNIFQPSGPALDLAAMFRVNADPFSGRPFIKPGDEGLDKLKKWTVGSVEGGRFTPGFAANLALPSFLSYHIPNIAKDLYYGNTSGALSDALGLVGLRPVTIKVGKQAEYALRARDEKISDVNKTLDDDLKVAKNVVLRRKLINNAMAKRARINAEYVKSRQR